MDFPSLIVCGPQITEISAEYLAWLRTSLLEDSRLEYLVRAIRDLPTLWSILLEADTALEAVPGRKLLQDFARWLDDGIFPLEAPEPLPNIQLTPLTVIIHIVEFMNYLNKLEQTSSVGSGSIHLRVLEGVRHGGVQGFCTGILTAIVIASSRDEQDINELGAVALRLAACIGVYVDLDSIFADPPREVVCLSGHWKTAAAEEYIADFLHKHPETYISVRSDVSLATFTLPKLSAPRLLRELAEHGIQTKEIHLTGRFHTPRHKVPYRKLEYLCEKTESLRFPPSTRTLVPVRRNFDGKVLVGTDPLHLVALRSILLEVSNWHDCITASVASLATSKVAAKHHITVLGLVECLPRSMRQTAGLQITHLRGPDIRQDFNSNEQAIYEYPESAIAVVGMACRFPGAESVEEFWDLIQNKRSMVGELPEGRFPRKDLRRDSEGKYRFIGNFLQQADCFDNQFFKKSSREAASADPQHRQALEVAYQALESAGYFNEKLPPTDVGCYIGVAASDYEDNVASHAPTAFSVLGTTRAFASGKISHFFGWSGPSLVFDTACSSSAVAIHTACRAILTGDCPVALAGGVNVITSPNLHQNLAAANFLSPTGGSKSFDERADGYCRGEGVGLVVLKKLTTAMADNDNILGVILGSALNQNDNAYPITVPVSTSQTTLYRRVLSLAGMHASAVSYVEAHGTGTPKGDPIECASIRQVFGGQSDRRLYFGSVKGNIGHTEAASGVAGLIKVLLMIQKQVIPPQANFTSLNPMISPLEPDNMAIATRAQPWDASFKAACLNNYGAAGSNAALILSQPPFRSSSIHRDQISLPRYPIIISARSQKNFRDYIIALRQFLTRNSSIPEIKLLASLAFNLSHRYNPSFQHMSAFSIRTIAELDDRLSLYATNPETLVPPKAKPIVLVLSGQTRNVIHFSEKVYHGCPILKSYLNKCDIILRDMGLTGLFPRIFQQDPIEDVVELHCMLFSLQYACAASWIDSGLNIQTVIGHSLGQLTAMCIAGVYSLPDALKLVSGRASLITKSWGPEKGSMLLVDSELHVIRKLLSQMKESGLGQSVDIACFNGPSSFVLAGKDVDIDTFQNLAALHLSVRVRRLDVTHGFHSELVDSIIPDYMSLAKSITFKKPTITIETCSPNESWTDYNAELVAMQSRQPVYFSEAVARIAQRLGACTWIEAGSSAGAVNMVRRILTESSEHEHSFHSIKLGTPDSLPALADMVVDLWKDGVNVQFWPFHKAQRSTYIPLNLPPYQFERSRHWLEYVDRHESMVPLQQEVVAETKPKLVSFIKYMDDKRLVAEFSVNQRCAQYQSLVRGHALLTKPLCPASLYVEMVTSAARSLVPDFSSSTTQNLSITNLAIQAPLGIDTNRNIALTLTSVTGAPGAWEFVLRSDQTIGNKSRSTKHATGKLAILPSSNKEISLRFSRYERLIDYARCEALLNEASAESMQGSIVYKMFDKVVVYSEIFHGVRKISTRQQEAAGLISMPDVDKELVAESAFNPLLVDYFTQVAGLHVNGLPDCGIDEIFVCNELGNLESNQISQTLGSGRWLVYTNFERMGDRDLISDIFVFDSTTKKLAVTIFGARFSRISIHSLAKALERANSVTSNSVPKIITAPTAVGQQRVSQPPREGQKQAAESIPILQPVPMRHETPFPSGTTYEQIKLAMKSLLHEVMDAPVEDITDVASLEDIGIDSLMAVEVISAIQEKFNIRISMKDYEEILDFKSLCSLISSRSQVLSPYPTPSLSAIRPISSSLGLSTSNTSFSSISGNTLVSGVDTPSTVTELNGGISALAGMAGMATYADQAQKLSNILADHLDLDALTEISRDTNLHELGMDSLVAIEVVSDIEKVFGKHIDLGILNNGCTFGAFCDMIVPYDQHLSSHTSKTVGHDVKLAQIEYPQPEKRLEQVIKAEADHLEASDSTGFLERVAEDFANIRGTYYLFAKETGFAEFRTKVYPKQAELVCAYIIEAFAALDCNLKSLAPGDPLPVVPHIPKHRKLMHQLYNALAEAGYIKILPNAMVRTSKPVPSANAQELYDEILPAFPHHSGEHMLLNTTGSNLAACLGGGIDPLQLLFANRAAKDLLEDVYTNSPMFATGTRMLAAFLTQTLWNYQGSEPIRILELGGGTGGTTKYLLDKLLTLGISFTYTFSDLSPSLVEAAKKKFKHHGCMEFMVLDVERRPKESLMHSFHVILSSNCVHATKDLINSTTNIHNLLSTDGFLCLLELTRPLSWLDCVFGLLEGWWLFEDGRKHVLADEYQWKDVLSRAGFRHVDWSDDASEESNQFRLIVAFSTDVTKALSRQIESPAHSASTKPRIMETIDYAEVDGTVLKADIYYPPQIDANNLRRPIALMIHGGGHIMLSRKDIRPKQTKHLLEHGLLPVSIDYRLCPELTLTEGPIPDVCRALKWARETLPYLHLQRPDIRPRGDKVVVVGWSTGGTLAMTLPFSAVQNSIKPPEAILAFYCPIDYESEFWRKPNFPKGAPTDGEANYDLLEAIGEHPITGYNVSTSTPALGGWLSTSDSRSRIALHMNMKAQTLPVLLNGLPTQKKAEMLGSKPEDWLSLPQPNLERVRSISPYAQIVLGNYKVPTFLIHGTKDDLVPWEHSQRTKEALTNQGVPSDIAIVEDAIHLFDLYRDPAGEYWRAVLKGYDFLFSHLN